LLIYYLDNLYKDTLIKLIIKVKKQKTISDDSQSSVKAGQESIKYLFFVAIGISILTSGGSTIKYMMMMIRNL
jgi:hypothetical protein